MKPSSRHIGHAFVDVLPNALTADTLYISGAHNVAAHLCCCGCGAEVITPLGPAGWSLQYDGRVSLYPSIGNGALACRSHYVIRTSQVRWLKAMGTIQHERAHQQDKQAAHDLLSTSHRTSLATRVIEYLARLGTRKR